MKTSSGRQPERSLSVCKPTLAGATGTHSHGFLILLTTSQPGMEQ
jgi:hypothetical protein